MYIGNVQASPFCRQQGLAARLQTLRHFARNPVYRLHEARLPKRPYKWVGIGSRQHLHGPRRKPGRVPIVLQSPFFKNVMDSRTTPGGTGLRIHRIERGKAKHFAGIKAVGIGLQPVHRSEEHTSELQSLMRISYAVFCLKKKTTTSKDT